MEQQNIVLTTEQRGIIKSNAPFLVVEAFAGASKTFTLVQYALARPYEKMLYVAFNKAIQMEAQAKFPPNVQCKTTHSLAYPYSGRMYSHKNGTLRQTDIMRFFNVPVLEATHLVNTIERFLASDDGKILARHLPPEVPAAYRDVMLDFAKRVWTEMKNVDNTIIRMPHDGYLKVYQLSGPDLSTRYQAILFDEFQDANACTASIYVNQRCKKVLVGDRHQSIYGFRHATRAFDAIPGEPERHSLTHSFRFGKGITNVANHLLKCFKNEQRNIVGRGVAELTHARADRSRQYTIICRTNAKVFANAVAYLNTKKVHFVGGIDAYPLGKLLDVFQIWNKTPDEIADPFFRTFADLDTLETYAHAVDDKEIMSLMSVVKEYKDNLPGLVAAVRAQVCENRDEADVLVSTVHRSKGLEYQQVVLEDDFEELLTESGQIRDMSGDELEQEVNILYVAITRASHALEMNQKLRAFLDVWKQVRAGEPAAAPVAATATAPVALKEADQVIQAAKTNAAATPVPAPVDPKLALESGIEKFIVLHGKLDEKMIAEKLNVPVEEVVGTIVKMISEARICIKFWEQNPVVLGAFKAHYRIA
ncbi:UvrD-helicase domain-containing protein [Noviherbaspirillum pedocola]|uniref:DNA 3'-5' helicase n=1 Tax=Noviherbaspirillum pedocola TaxID=2801341 RepID=A0A934SZ33_9BURK|nr:UvrD-helicase domain-containing protein [Noviherbaspirillum pedocola]MBK4737945.1 ATP-dependent helicase [Noviherbaspirillum pedocola]